MTLAGEVVSTEDASPAGTIPFRKQTSPATLLPKHALRYGLIFTAYESHFLYCLYSVFTRVGSPDPSRTGKALECSPAQSGTLKSGLWSWADPSTNPPCGLFPVCPWPASCALETQLLVCEMGITIPAPWVLRRVQ